MHYTGGNSSNYSFANSEVATLGSIATARIQVYKELLEVFPEKKEQLERLVQLQEIKLLKTNEAKK
ncbi:MAG: hypothetical protein ACK5MZ_02250 [Aestuariibaculum sp.]